MFRKSYNRAVLRICIETVTPLLIRAGDSGLDPVAADLTCVRTRHGRHGRTVYIPGSSLRGVLRSTAESAVRSQTLSGGVRGACDDPLDHKTHSCGGQTAKVTESHAVHKRHCLACRLFGSLSMKGRASIRDAFPWSPDIDDPESDFAPGGKNQDRANQLEVRHGVAIDRITGSARHGGLFDQELVPAGISFWGDIALENYQTWQLGLLAQALAQVNDGIAQLGSSKSRGLGVAKIAVERIVHEQSGASERPLGVGDLASGDEREAYGLLPEAELPAARGIARGLATRFEIAETAAWLDAGLAALGALQ